MHSIVIDGLTKTYPGGKTAVSGVSLALEPGEVFGFLGPNGAGKTTTVKVLTGTLAPTQGSCRVLALDPAQQPAQVHAVSGVVTEHAQMYDHLTGLQNLQFFGAVFGAAEQESTVRAMDLLEQLQLTDAKDRKLATYSTGMRQKLSLARALMHRPQVLFLDEPTSGLDPESTLQVNRLIRTLAQEQGATIFLCTHQLRYAQEICTRYGLIDEGKLIAQGSLQQLRAMAFSGTAVRIRSSVPPQGLAYREAAGFYEVNLPSQEDIPAVVRQIVQAGGDVFHVSAQQPSLEDIYFALTAEQEGRAQ